MPRRVILALDVGTTKVRAHAYDADGSIVSGAERSLELIRFDHQGQRRVEMDPDKLWHQVREVLGDSVSSAGSPEVLGLGIATQRNSFLTWDGRSGRPFQRFVAWNDGRSGRLNAAWNSSWTFGLMHLLGGLLHFLSRSPRWLAARIYRLVGAMVTMRLMATLEESAAMREALAKGHLVYGCIESWLLCKLSGGGWEAAATEVGLASATGMFDPFRLDWGRDILRLLRFPAQLLPEVRSTTGDWGRVGPGVWAGSEGVAVAAVMGDQMAAAFGCGCWREGDVKVSLGTGTFVDVVLRRPHASMRGFIPIVGWRLAGEEPVHLAEGFAHDTASALNWAHGLGLIPSVEDSASLAASVPDSGGVFFVPAFGGLQVPVNDVAAASLFIGMGLGTTKAHLTRALLESLAFRAHQILREATREMGKLIAGGRLRACGGVANNDFILQLIADLGGREVERMPAEATSRGVALAAGLQLGVWSGREALDAVLVPEAVFVPRETHRDAAERTFRRWLQAQQRSLAWHRDDQAISSVE